jgi:hypothetical protein
MEGDAFTFATPSSACVATITYNLMLVGPNNKTVATLIDMLGNANTSAIVQHNTCFTGTQGGSVAETYPGFTGMVQKFQSNMMWNLTPNQGFKLYVAAGPNATVNICLPANCTNNGGFNLETGSNGYGYNNLTVSGGTLGTNDVEGNPNFVDYTRNIRGWDGADGGPGTDTHAYTLLTGDNGNIVNLINWVKAGFLFQNAAFHNTAHDGTDIGATTYLVVNPTMSVSPVNVTANTSATLTVTGSSTSWITGSTTFSVSGVSGVSITSQTINNVASATLTIQAGTTTGVVTLTDGSISTNFTIIAQTVSSGANARRRPS